MIASEAFVPTGRFPAASWNVVATRVSLLNIVTLLPESFPNSSNSVLSSLNFFAPL